MTFLAAVVLFLVGIFTGAATVIIWNERKMDREGG